MTPRTLSSALLSALLLALPANAAARDRTIMLTGFDRVRIDGPFRVTLTTDRPPGAVISGDTRAIDAVDIRVQGRTLIISPSPNQWGGWPGERREMATIAATTHEVGDLAVIGGGVLDVDAAEGQELTLAVTGSGRLTVGALHADRLVATVVGSGTLAVAGDANEARFTNNGTGTIDAQRLQVADLTAISDGPGESSFAAERSARVTATGLGLVDIAGDASCTVRGPGPVRCDHPEP